MLRRAAALSLNTKVAALGTGGVLVTAVALVLLAVSQSGRYHNLAKQEVDQLVDADLDHIAQSIWNLVRTENDAVQERIDRHLHVARHVLASAGEVSQAPTTVTWSAVNQVTGRQTTVKLPQMLLGGEWLQPNTDASVTTPVVDEVAALVGETATIFQRMDEAGDMLRVATTVRDAAGRRAIGTYIPAVDDAGAANPVVAAVLSGRTYHGTAYVVNAWYLTAYEAIRDRQSRVVGMLYVGVQLSAIEASVRRAILQTTVGETGYAYAIRGTGPDRGRYIVSHKGERDGENIWDNRDSDGAYPIQAIIAKAVTLRPGELATIRYRWQNPGEATPRWKIARVAYFEPWDWVIGTSVYEDELQRYRAVLQRGRQRMSWTMAVAGLGIALAVGLCGLLTAWSTVRPIQQLRAAVETVTQGDLEQTVEVTSLDEVGQLSQGFNLMVSRLRDTLAGLQASEERLSLVIEATADGFWDWDLRTETATLSARYYTMLGYEPGEFVADRAQWRQMIHPADLPATAELLALHLSGGSPSFATEFRMRTKSGDYLWILCRGRVVARDAAGQPLRAVGTHSDITLRRRAEDALRESEGLYHSLVESLPVGVFRRDCDGHFTFTNRAFGELTGQVTTAAAAVTEPTLAQDREVIETGTTIVTEDERALPGGETQVLQTTRFPLCDAGGVIVGVQGIVTDISERRLLEQQTRQAQRMESIGRLAGGVAHDFNNLLAPIMGFAELVLMDLEPDDPHCADLTEIMEAAERARGLTRQLLAFGRRQELDLQPVDLRHVVANIWRLLRRTVREDVQIDMDLSDTLGTVRADVGQIEQVLMNLAVNAADAMPDGGQITIALADVTVGSDFAEAHEGIAPGRYTRLSVRDTGCGMDERTLSRLFEPFFTTKGKGRGTGLGLATVYGIVRQHAGTVQVTSKVGQGSEFAVLLPHVPEPTGPVPSEPEALAAKSVPGAVVMVVDDDERVRRLVCRMLKSLGHQVVAAASGAECLEMMAGLDTPIDLLLTDVVMPKMNGKQLYERAAAAQPGLRVLYMSGHTDDIIARRGVVGDGQVCLEKPFTMRTMAAHVQQVLEQPGPSLA